MSIESLNTERRSKRILIILVLLALVLRIGTISALRSWRFPGAIEHVTIARMLLAGEGFSFIEFGYRGPSSVQSPPYPLLLAGLFWLFGIATPASYVAAMVINAVVGSTVVILTYYLGRTLGASNRVGLLSAAACAVWPTQVYAPTHVQAIAFITAGVTAVMILFYRCVRSGRLRPWVAYSAIGCLAALTEPVLLPAMMLSGILILVWPGLSRAVQLRNAAVLFLAAVVIIGPWSIRNRLVHGAWIPIKSSFWVNVWKGNNDYATGTDRLALTPEQRHRLESVGMGNVDSLARDPEFDHRRQYDMLTAEQRARLWQQPDAVREQVFKEWTSAWIREHPGQYARLCLLRLAKSLWLDWDNPKSRNMVYMGSRTVLVALSLCGLVLAIRRGWSLLFPLMVVGTALFLFALTITAARFSIPFEPLQFCLAAECVAAVSGWFSARHQTS